MLRRIGVICVCVACFLPAGQASAAVRVFPGCGATLAACIATSPAGTTIRLQTNKLIAIPDDLTVTKGLRFVAARGYAPRIGRTGSSAFLSFEPTESHATVGFRGITFRQVGVYVQFQSRTGHRVFFEDNRVRNNSGSNGDVGISIYYSSTSRGSLSVRNNDISASGSGIDVRVQGGPAVITGNRVTAPVLTDSQAGINLYGGGSGLVRATIASNLVHDVAGCNCGNPVGLQSRAFGTATLAVRVLNNTVDRAGLDSTHGGYGIEIVNSTDPGARVEAGLYNNIVSNTRNTGIILYQDPQVAVSGNLNDSYGAPNADVFGSYDMGTTLHVRPLYGNVGAGNYRLRSGSPLVNGGQTCIAGIPLPRADALNRFRLAGRAVDLGAYERGSTISGGTRGRNRSGTDGADAIGGTSGRDILCGLGGADTLAGLGGADIIFGGDSNDHLLGGGGADRLVGGIGSDRAFGEAGNDLLALKDGVGGNDRAVGGFGRDSCATDPGDIRRSCP